MSHLATTNPVCKQQVDKLGLQWQFTTVSRILLTLLIMLSLMAGRSLQAATPSDKLLPPNVYAYASFPNVADMKKAFEASSGSKLFKDEAFAEFRKEIEAKIKEFSDKAEKKIGIPLLDVANIPTGEVAFAFLQTSEANPAFVGLLDFGKNRETVDKLIAKAIAEVKKENPNLTISDEDVDGTKIYLFKENNDDSDEEEETGKLKDQFAYFIKETMIVAGTSPEALKDVLARWDGKHDETFAENKIYQHIIKRCQPEGTTSLLKWYMDPLGLFTNGLAASGEMNQSVRMGMAMLPMLGITKFKAIGGSSDDGGDKLESRHTMMAYIDLPAEGVLKVLECPATTLAPPKWVSADVMAYSSLNWDVDNAIKAIRTMVDNFQGPGAFDKLMDQAAEQPRGPQVHPIKDFANHLTGKTHTINYPPKIAEDFNLEEFTRQAQIPSVLIALETKNADKIKGTLDKISKTPGFPGQVRQFKGETLYELPIPMRGGNQNQKFVFCVAKGNLIFTTNVKSLEEIVRGNDQKSLVDSEDYKRVAANFPDKTSVIMYQKQDAQIKLYWKLMKSEKIQEEVEKSPFKGIHFNKLPAYEAIQKYLVEQGAYVIPDEHGVVMSTFAVKK